MAPPLPPDLNEADHPLACKMRLGGWGRIGLIVLTLLAAFLAALFWES